MFVRPFVLSLTAALLLGLTGNLLRAQEAISNSHRMALYSLPAVVRIFDGSAGKYQWRDKTYTCQKIGSGSGFFVHPSGYIVTNAHVVETTAQGEEAAKQELLLELIRKVVEDPSNKIKTPYEQILANPKVVEEFSKEAKLLDFKAIHLVRTSDGSDHIFEVKKFGGPVGPDQKDVAVIKIEIRNAPTLVLGDSDRVNVVDYVMVIGYPGVAERAGLMDDKSMLVASVTDGKVSGKKRLASGAPLLQISAPASHGNSGGPALNARGEVIGLLTFHIEPKGYQVSGFTFLTASNTVKEFVRDAGISVEESLTDRYYREGLDLMWRGQYGEARVRFREVQNLFPQHSEVDALILLCSENMGKERPPLDDPGRLAQQHNNSGKGGGGTGKAVPTKNNGRGRKR